MKCRLLHPFPAGEPDVRLLKQKLLLSNPRHLLVESVCNTVSFLRCRRLALACMPVSLTCGFHESSLIVDPSAAEEPLLGATVAVIMDEAGDLLGAGNPWKLIEHCADTRSLNDD